MCVVGWRGGDLGCVKARGGGGRGGPCGRWERREWGGIVHFLERGGAQVVGGCCGGGDGGLGGGKDTGGDDWS